MHNRTASGLRLNSGQPMLSAWLSLVCLSAVVNNAARAADESVSITAPDGWTGETISLPTSFAPDMKLKGTEVIRFAPGMFKPDSDSFFSYIFVFHLPDQQPPGRKTLQSEMLTYYRGLGAAVGKGRGVKLDPKTFTFEFVKPPSDKPPTTIRVGDADLPVVAAKLDWVEPFATGKQQTLHFEITSGPCPNAKDSFVLVCVSPAKTSEKVWSQLRSIRKDGIRFSDE